MHRINRVVYSALLSLLVSYGTTMASSPVGVWSGKWVSQSTGHQGPMRARIRRLDQDTYRAWFAGRFAGVVPFAYPATLQRIPGTGNCYRSSQQLPLMGSYTMTAAITPHRFDARFRSRDDWGTFQMRRRR